MLAVAERIKSDRLTVGLFDDELSRRRDRAMLVRTIRMVDGDGRTGWSTHDWLTRPISALETEREVKRRMPISPGMTEFPQEVDIRKTSHFLFEVGSLMALVFGGLFLASVLVISAAYTTGVAVSVGVLAAVLFGLLAANGVVFLYWSTTFDAR